MDKLKSRKFWIALVSAIIIIANQGLGFNLPAETIMGFAGVVISYIFGQAYVDGKQAEANGVVFAPAAEVVSPAVAKQGEGVAPTFQTGL